MSIQEHLNKIRNAVYGREVRESIAKGIETAYNDASEKDNANMEVKIARGTHPNLRSRLDETTTQVAQANQGVVATNTRIDQIITTPVDGVSAEEIIDGRDGEESLGANSRLIKSHIDTKLSNLVTDGDFSSVSNWNRYEISQWYINPSGWLEITPEVGADRPRVNQSIGTYSQAKKLYVRVKVRSKSHSIRRVSAGIYTTGDYTTKNIEKPLPSFFEWETIEGIIELPTQTEENLNVQIFAQPLASRPFSGRPAFDIADVMVLDLSRAYGVGNEPELADISDLVENLPFIDDNLSVGDLAKTRLSSVETTTPETITKLPVDPNKFDEDTWTLLSYTRQDVQDTSHNVSWIKNNNKYLLKLAPSGKDTETISNVTSNIVGSGIPLQNIDYVDIYLNCPDETKLTNVGINLVHSDGVISYSLNQISQLRRQGNGDIRIRIPKRKFTNIDGGKLITGVVVTARGTGFELYVDEVIASKGSKGALYMYFDDATEGQYEHGFRIMEKYGLRGTVAAPTERVGLDTGTSGQRMTWAQLREVQSAGWLVVGHGLDEKSLTEQTPEEIERQIKKMSQDLFDRGFIFGSKCIVAPQGSWSIEVDRIARKYLAFARTWIYENDDTTMEYPHSYTRNQNYTGPHLPVDDVKAKIDLAISRREEVSLAFHLISEESPADGKHWNSVSDFEEICAYGRQKVDEGVLDVVTWQDSHLQSKSIQPIDLDGNTYLVHDGEPRVVELPID